MIFSFVSLRTAWIVPRCCFRTFFIVVARDLKKPSSHQFLASKRKYPFCRLFIFRYVLISWRNIFVLGSISWRFEGITILSSNQWSCDNIFIWNYIQLSPWIFLCKRFRRILFTLYSSEAFALVGISREWNLLFFKFLLCKLRLLSVIIIKNATIFWEVRSGIDSFARKNIAGWGICIFYLIVRWSGSRFWIEDIFLFFWALIILAKEILWEKNWSSPSDCVF